MSKKILFGFAASLVAGVVVSVPAFASDIVYPGGGTLAQVVDGVKSASQSTGAAASQVLESVSGLAAHTERLRAECGRFLEKVRAA